jgi:hypothetical protein
MGYLFYYINLKYGARRSTAGLPRREIRKWECRLTPGERQVS